MERQMRIPSALKAPQSRLPVQKLALPKIQEGSSLFGGRREPFVPTRLTRRSKSVSDLREVFVMPKPKPNVASLSVKPIASTAPKRPLVTSKANDGCSKPKVSKKIAPWDYKSKFNDLNQKHQVLQNSAKDLELKSREYDNLEAKHMETQQELQKIIKENTALKTQNSSLTSKCAMFEKLEEQNSILQDSILKYKSELETCLAEKNALIPKYEEALKTIENTQIALRASELSVANLKEGLVKHQLERQKMHNIIQDLKGNIRVFCRIRPVLTNDDEKRLCRISFPDEHSLEISKQTSAELEDSKSEFSFDKVFPQDSTQIEVFEELSHLVQSALDGYDVCVFAYGQTGSGKTYTMQGGTGSNMGMIPRTSSLIFNYIEELRETGWEYKVEVSFLEVYNEVIRDLLNQHEQKKMDIYYNEGKGTTVTNLTIQPVKSAAELEHFISVAHNFRTTAATNFNAHSSRSHAVTKIYIAGTNSQYGIAYRGSINLVDLAGSESAKTSGSDCRLQETKNINKSLSTLGDVMYALCNKKKHIPYRNSKLTYLLQSSLGGNSKTLMIVNVSPFVECFRESIQSLRFAAKVKEVKTVIKRNKSNLQ